MKTRVNISFEMPCWLEYICVWPVLFFRLLRYGYPFRRLPLSQGKFTIVDPADFYILSKFKWSILKRNKKFYAVHNVWDDSAQKYKALLMHRFLMNPPDNMVVDHENSDGLDNRKANLRVVLQLHNTWNRRKDARPTSSRFKGVYWDRKCKKWRGRIRCNNQQIELGLFVAEIDAARAYDAAAKKYHGEYARLNFPE